MHLVFAMILMIAILVAHPANAGFFCGVHKATLKFATAPDLTGYLTFNSWSEQQGDLLEVLKETKMLKIEVFSRVFGVPYPEEQLLFATPQDTTVVEVDSIQSIVPRYSFACRDIGTIKKVPYEALALLEKKPVATHKVSTGDYSHDLCMSYRADLVGAALEATCKDARNGIEEEAQQAKGPVQEVWEKARNSEVARLLEHKVVLLFFSETP